METKFCEHIICYSDFGVPIKCKYSNEHENENHYCSFFSEQCIRCQNKILFLEHRCRHIYCLSSFDEIKSREYHEKQHHHLGKNVVNCLYCYMVKLFNPRILPHTYDYELEEDFGKKKEEDCKLFVEGFDGTSYLTSFKKILGTQRSNCKLEQQQNLIKERSGSELASFIKQPVSYLGHSISLMSYKNVYGNSHKKLNAQVGQICFNSDLQNRFIIGLVQSFGMGKTKTSLMLSALNGINGKYNIVIPWRALFNDGKTGESFIMDYQKSLYEKIKDKPVNRNILENFSKCCIRSVRLAFLARFALFEECCNKKIIDKTDPSDRFDFSNSLLQSSSDSSKNILDHWIYDWCESNKNAMEDDILYNKLVNNLESVPDMNILFVLDEAHTFKGHLIGYCLHNLEHNNYDVVKAWESEIKNREPFVNGKNECTDLFYQVNCVLLEYLKRNTQASVGFLFTSTTFSIWSKLELQHSPLSRGMIYPFKELFYFDQDSFYEIIKHFFSISEEEWSQVFSKTEFKPDIFQRPHSVSKLIENIFNTLMQGNNKSKINFLVEILNKTVSELKSIISTKIRSLNSSNNSIGNYSKIDLYKLIYTVRRLAGGCFYLDEGDKESISQLIGDGIARIETINGIDHYKITEPLVNIAIDEIYEKEKDNVIYGHFQKSIITNRIVVSQDHSNKGYSLEKIIAWMCINLKLELGIPEIMKRGINLNKIAGKCDELSWKGTEVKLFSEVAESEIPYLIFPSTSAGPDLWFSYCGEGKRIVFAIQSKAVSRVYSLVDTMDALKSLNVHKMFKKNKQAYAEWEQFKPKLGEYYYYRVIVSPFGFNDDVHFKVAEYNILNKEKKIFLVDCNQLKEAGMTDQLCKFYLSNGNLPTPYDPKHYHSHEGWMQQSSKERVLKAILEKNCRVRGMTISGTNLDKVSKLNGFNIQNYVKDFNFDYIYPKEKEKKKKKI